MTDPTDLDRALIRAHAEASGRLHDPTDATLYVDPSTLERGTDGTPTTAALDAALDRIVTERPYLAAPDPIAWPDGDQGPQGAIAQSVGRSNLRDHEFFQRNRDAILRAAAEGRIARDV